MPEIANVADIPLHQEILVGSALKQTRNEGVDVGKEGLGTDW